LFYWCFIYSSLYSLAGGLLLSFGNGSDVFMKKNNKLLWLIPVLLISLVAVYFGFFQSTLGVPSGVRLAVPHFGAYECKAVGTGSPVYSLGSAGFWIDKQSIGVYTDQVTSVNVIVPQTFWDSYFKSYLGGGIRALIRVCDSSKSGCVDSFQSLTFAGTTSLNLPFTGFNPNDKSLYVVIQSRNTFLSSWKDDSVLNANSKISYSFTKYGLKYVSTTGNPAGSFFAGCESSCDLSCPTQKSRSGTGLIYTSKNSLLPTESVAVLEYWEDLNFDLNSQFGANIYSSSTGLFCFGGVIYSSKTISLDSGEKIIYPDVATRNNKECCPGAVISTSSEDKICQSDYTWKTITKDTRIKCVSDMSCPGQGQFTCQNKVKSGWSCGSDGYCSQSSGSKVSCCNQADCAADQYCQSYKCVGGNVEKPVCSFQCCVGDSDYADKVCAGGFSCVNHTCLNSTGGAVCDDKFFGLVVGSAVSSSTCGSFFTLRGFGCAIGLSKPVVENYCKYDWTFIIIISVFLVVILAVLFFGLRGRKKSSKKSSSRKMTLPSFVKKWQFWAVLAGVVAVIIWFKYIFWIGLLLFVLWLLYMIFIKKYVSWLK
jgi:hypothetical protein